MKKIILVLISLTFFNSETTTAQERLDLYELRIEGMGCAFCSIAVQKKFRSLDGIDNEEIDLETGVFTFTLPPENKQTKVSINDMIDETGYELAYYKVVRVDGTSEEYDKEKS